MTPASTGNTTNADTQSLSIIPHYPGGSLYLDEYDEEWGWAHPTDVVIGLAQLAIHGSNPDDAQYKLQITENRKHGHSGLVAEHIENKQLDPDYRRIASIIVGTNGDAKQHARKLLRAMAISRHGILYRTAGHRSGHMRLDRIVAQVQQRYIKLKPGGFTWSRELQTISGVPVLIPIISMNKLSPWRRVMSLSQCEDSAQGFQTFVLFLLLLHDVNPGAVQFQPTSVSCAWPELDDSLADEERNVIRADTSVTCVTSSILQCHTGHIKVGMDKFHVSYAGLWKGDKFQFKSANGRVGFKRVSGIDELNRKRLDEEHKIPIMDVFDSWQDVAQVACLKTVQKVYDDLFRLDEGTLRNIRAFYSNLWEPLDGIRLELSDEEVFTDLAISVTSVMNSCGFRDMMRLVQMFIQLIEQEWVREAKDSKRFPCRMAAPYNPAVLLNKERETYYTFGASFGWQEKSRVTMARSAERTQVTIPGALSRVYKDGLVIGDLDGTVWELNEAELSILRNGEIGWITEFILNEGSYRVVEVDVLCAEMFEPDPEFRRQVAKEAQTDEPRIASVRRDDTDWVRKSLPVSVMLLAAQLYVSTDLDPEPLRGYDDVKEEIRAELQSDKLNSIDLAYFHGAMGSYGSRNKIWSARALAEHKRLWSLLGNPTAPRLVEWKESRVLSRLIYSDREAVFVRARRPWDTAAALSLTLASGLWVLADATKERDFYDLGTLLTAVIGTVTGVTGLYHTIRYRAWALGDAVRAYRKCTTIEEMRTVMHLDEVHKTLLDAGEIGRFTDGVRTCAYSDNDSGNFAVAQGLPAEMFERCGGKLGLDSDADDVIIYKSRIRKVEIKENGYAHVTSQVGTFPVIKATRLKGTIMEGCYGREVEPVEKRKLRWIVIRR